MAPKLSLCMIVKDEEKGLGQCLSSIAKHVDEIVVVDTGSSDRTKEIALSFGAKVCDYTRQTHPASFYFDDESSGTVPPYSNTWRFCNFAGARQHSFDQATGDFVLWVDADDVVEGAENLRAVVEEMERDRLNVATLGYDYHTDSAGRITCKLWRERIIRNRIGIRWTNPVHEVLIPCSADRRFNSVRIVHNRHKVQGPQLPHRNFKILQRHWAATEKTAFDARTLFYLGNEARFIDKDLAVKYFTQYLSHSGWDEERSVARNLLGEIYEDRKEYAEAFSHYAASVADFQSNPDGWFGMARCAYYREDWDKCVRYSKCGFDVGNTELVIMTNPLDRTYRPHIFLNIALNRLGRMEEAIASCEEGLKAVPEDTNLQFNKKAYEQFLASLKTGKPSTPVTQLRLDEPVGDPPQVLPDEVVAALAIQLWKQAVRESDGARSKLALACLPSRLWTHEKVRAALLLQEDLFGKQGNLTGPLADKQIWRPYRRSPNYPRGAQLSDVPVAVITPHSQAWGIPETFVTEDLPLGMTTAQLQAFVGTMWSEYIAHDEILSAIKFLEHAPYRVRHTDLTLDLLRRTRQMTEWIQDEKQYDRGNTPTVSGSDLRLLGRAMFPVSRENPTPVPGAGGRRYQWFTDRMRPGSSICDFGSIDGEMSNRWGLAGFKVVGLDIATESVRIANEEAEREKTGAVHIRTYFKDALKHVAPQSFDYSVCGDVYEHLMDPVHDLLVPAKQVLKPSGQFLMATPHGSWYRGQFNAAYHPWLWGEEGEAWNTINRNRAHIIAPTVWTVVDNFRAAGFYVSNCVVVESHGDVLGQGNIFAQGLPKPPEGYADGKDVVFYIGGNATAPWTPHTADLKGQGGSEVMAIQMSRRLAAMGHRVRVYSDCGEWGEGIYDGVEYHDFRKFHDLKCDVLVVSRQSHALGTEYNVDAKVRLLWTHDVVPQGLTHELALRADKILVLSEWHRGNVIQAFPWLPPEQLLVTRNGIDPSRFTAKYTRNPHKVSVSSSPDRYLPSLLAMWPRIREKVPDAELHVFYGFENWKLYAKQDPGQSRLIAELEQKLADMAPLGVHSRGRLPQQDLAREMLESGVWLYSTWFSETFCISAAEAQAAGLACVTSPIAALNEVLGDRGVMIRGDWLSKDYQDAFVNAAVDALLNTPQERRDKLSKEAMERFGFDPLVREWDTMFRQLLADGLAIPPFSEV